MSIKSVDSSLVLRNRSNQTVKVLGAKIKPGKSVDLFDAVVGLTEGTVIDALSAPDGSIFRLIAKNVLVIVGSNLTTFESDSTESDELVLDFVDDVTKENLTFTVDYNLAGAADPPAGTVFSRQADITAFLTANNTTAFKSLQLAYNALPYFIKHAVVFNLAAGVHRPSNPLASNQAWNLDLKRIDFETGSISYIGAAPSLYAPYASYGVGVGSNLSITGVQTASRDPFIDVSGVPFAVTAWAANTSYTVGDRRWNGAALGGTSGAAASIVAGATSTFGHVRLTGLTGMTVDALGHSLTISGAASAANNGTFPITNFISATSVDILNRFAVVPDASNGAISWAGSWTGTAASIVAGAAANHMRLTGLTGLNVGAVGHYLTISGAASAANNGTWQISNFISATSCDAYNPAAVVPDANNGAISWTELSGNTYVARIAGISAGSGGPTGQGITDIVDNTITWRFLCAGPAFLKGSTAVLSTGQAVLIHNHTANRLSVMNVLSPSPAGGTVTLIGRPSTILRNSINDTTNFRNAVALFSANSARHGQQGAAIATVGSGANILQDIAFDNFGATGAVFNNLTGALVGTRVLIDHDSALEFPFNRAAASQTHQNFSAGLGPMTLNFYALITRQQTLGPLGALNTDSTVLYNGCYIQGCREGLGINSTARGLADVFTGCVFDYCGNFYTIFSKSILLSFPDVGTAGLSGVGKETEIRSNRVANIGLWLFMSTIGRFNALRITFKNNYGPCVVIGADCGIRQKLNTSATQGLFDGGGNTDVGIQLDGPNSSAELNAATNVTGTLGNIKTGSTIISYPVIQAAGSVTDSSNGNIITKN